MKKIKNFINNPTQKIAVNFFNNTKHGKLKVIFPNNEVLDFVGNEKGVCADIKLNNYKILTKLLRRGAIGFAEAYMDNDFETNSLKNLLIFSKQNESYFVNSKYGKNIYKLFSKLNNYLNNNTKYQSKKNISYHYDLGNKFYKLWLDQSMTYSSGLFSLPNDDLSRAQLNKYEKIVAPMNLNDSTSVLEIGCGWGGFSNFIAKRFGSKVNAITNSKEQFEYTSKLINKEGLNEKVKVELMDYRDVKGKFDKISSIEMFEAVGKKFWSVYFEKIKNSLNNDGLATFQIITINEDKREFYQNNQDFIQKYIFPGGLLPSKKQIIQTTNSIGLDIKEFNSFGKSYANTLNIWNKKFQSNWSQIEQQGYSKRFKRMWEYYLSYCEVGFISKSTDVSHFLLRV